MVHSTRAVLALSWAAAFVAAEQPILDDDMGPATFMWPTAREWTATKDNTAPCGSPDGVGNRTTFPLTGGKIAMVDQIEGYNLEVAISYSNDPSSNSDFAILIPSTTFKELDEGHTCVPVDDPPKSVTAGSNATLQMIYTADFDTGKNETFYACADITYVTAASFDISIPCFNATEPDDGSSSPSSTASTTSAATATNSSSSKPGGGGGGGVSKGAIAGAVVGSVCGAAMLAGAAVWFYRRWQQQKRIDEMARSSRNVAWEQQDHVKGKDSVSSVGMHNV